MFQFRFSALLFLAAAASLLPAQTPHPAPPAKPQPDVLILKDDEKLVGHLVRSAGSSVVFKSDMVGEITVEWSEIKELHTSGRYAVLEKHVKLGRHSDLSHVSQGSLDVAGSTITVHPQPAAAPQNVPVANSEHIIDEATFEKDVLHDPPFLKAWNGTITAGASIVEATQQSRTFTGAVSLVRAIPAENWLDARNRTSLDFSASDGFLEQPNTPRLKTEILHADAERDQYFPASRVYGFGQAIFDHNYSQGLDLQQSYGGGIGWTTIKRSDLTLDLKGSVSYVRQAFQSASLDHQLVASAFAENLLKKLPRGITFLEQISATPTWNELHAWLANANASLTAPVYKRLMFTVGIQDGFLNDPPPGFRKNSFQATTGLSYSLR